MSQRTKRAIGRRGKYKRHWLTPVGGIVTFMQTAESREAFRILRERFKIIRFQGRRPGTSDIVRFALAWAAGIYELRQLGGEWEMDKRQQEFEASQQVSNEQAAHPLSSQAADVERRTVQALQAESQEACPESGANAAGLPVPGMPQASRNAIGPYKGNRRMRRRQGADTETSGCDPQS